VNSFKSASIAACGTLRREVRELADDGPVGLERLARLPLELVG
jgi:hypothetical protein